MMLEREIRMLWRCLRRLSCFLRVCSPVFHSRSVCGFQFSLRAVSSSVPVHFNLTPSLRLDGLPQLLGRLSHGI